MSFLCRFFGCVLCSALLNACSPATFLISKDGTAGYFGRERASIQQLLCMQHDLDAILTKADFSPDLKKDFLHYTCSEDRSYEKLVSLYLFLTPQEKNNLKSAFINQGYEVNHMPC